MHNEELNKVRIALAEEKEAMEKYGAEGKPKEGLNTDTGVSGGPMNTISGVLLDPKNVKADDIRLYDIAHPLSFICRGVGQVKHFLSVGQHCINCARFQEAIYAHFGLAALTEEERELVHLIDDAMLWNEAKELFAHVDELEPPLLSTIPNFKVRDFQDVENEFNLMAVNLLHRLGDSRL